MTKLNWDKADYYESDPGSVVELREPPVASTWVGPAEQARKRQAQQDAENERVKRFRLLREAVQLEPIAVGLECRQSQGRQLDYFDQVALRRWGEIKHVLLNPYPSVV